MSGSTLWDSVGNTPLLKISSLSRATGNEIFGKAEFMNPGGSIKDRAAKGMIRDAEVKGLLSAGSTIVEGTAGNTGIGLGLLGVERGYKVVVTMPDNQAREKYELLDAMGVEVRKVPVVPFSNPNHFFHAAKALAEANSSWWWPNQFDNPANGDQEMIEMLYHLARHDALVVGTSAALNVRGAFEIAKQHRGQGLRIVTLLCDHGSRYLSKIFNPEFLRSKNLTVKPLEFA